MNYENGKTIGGISSTSGKKTETKLSESRVTIFMTFEELEKTWKPRNKNTVESE